MIRHRKNLILVILFVLVTSSLSGLVALTLRGGGLQASKTYYALFSDVSGMKSGSDVRAAGVSVGKVGSMTLANGNLVKVTFTLPKTLTIGDHTEVKVRWANLTGDRYLDVSNGSSGPALPAGSTIPVSRTEPALDIDTVFNGFQPLLQALNPAQINQLTSNIIAVTQGESGAVDALLTHVASFTGTLGQRDQLIGSVIDNLGQVLTTVDHRKGDFGNLITRLGGLMHGLAKDKVSLVHSLGSINTVAARSASLLRVIRPEVVGTLKQARRVATHINNDSAYVNKILSQLPGVIGLLGRGGSYGSFFNFYLCGINFKISVPGGNPYYSPMTSSKEARCSY